MINSLIISTVSGLSNWNNMAALPPHKCVSDESEVKKRSNTLISSQTTHFNNSFFGVQRDSVVSNVFVSRQLNSNMKLCFTPEVAKVSNSQIFSFSTCYFSAVEQKKNFAPMSAVCYRKLYGKCGFNFEEHSQFSTNGGRQKLPLCVQ